ncbi:MAG: hypothetical protein OXD33_01010 [Rhodobacteraceae bacterium]|nr:hypothetical protein [Paracoccaceae bacterium]MCY4326094.1 hypothetical protein [Paracoccaceae bacterium]
MKVQAIARTGPNSLLDMPVDIDILMARQGHEIRSKVGGEIPG